ncbi:hypothetical protein [Chryseobacterium daeguense]|uniref:hypothetical protein n=1 Tax=Chryseobacterium daeguense TaxID=412438 RepID=UPI00040679CC|nr:hypothetical protein [Chryseobacterium daeguense]
MKQILFFLILLSTLFNSQVIKDSILGRPKYVKEYVIFLNDSGPFTFMKGDDEYGHATIMEPEILRESMRDTWFETDFCRYINNETYYDKNRNITKQIWYYKSGKIVDDYDYTYDNLNRLVLEKVKGYSEKAYRYFYEGNNKTAKFVEAYFKSKDGPLKKFVNNYESFKPLIVTKFDTISKTDSIFTITNDIWKKIDKGYIQVKDSIYYKKLTRVKTYDNHYKVIEDKFFKYESDFQNRKIYLDRHLKYEYDNFGNVIKEINFSDGNLYSYIISRNGKIIKEEKKDNAGKTSYIVYTYSKDQKLERRIMYYNEKVWYDTSFEYKNNYITKVLYLDKYDKKEPSIINFKYTFDKQKNWTEIIKNVNGKDLYKWIRKIEYYK